jgi:lysophospholipid hydrolase
MTGTSSSNATSYMSGLDNEVEILFFSAGSTLVKAGERSTGKTPVTQVWATN